METNFLYILKSLVNTDRMGMLKKHRDKVYTIWSIILVLLVVSCRTSRDDLYVKCKDEILNSYFFISLTQYLEENFKSEEFKFKYHRLNEGAELTPDSKEDDIELKKNKICVLTRDIAGETGIQIIQIEKKGNDYEFYGVENCSFSIVKTLDINNYINKNFKGYEYFDTYDESLLDKYPQCVFKLKDEYFLVINQLWPPG